MVICLERGADLHMAQLMPLLLTASWFSKIQIGFTFLVPAYPGSPGKGLLNGCVCVCVSYKLTSYVTPDSKHVILNTCDPVILLAWYLLFRECFHHHCC